MDAKLPPGIRVQKSMYEFLEPPAQKDRGIILLGAYRPPAQSSELARFLNHYGFGPIRHPEYCGDFEAFKGMAKSAGALIVRPEGRGAGEELSSRLGIPAHPSFMAYDREGIFRQYQEMADFLNSLDGADKKTEDLESYFAPSLELMESRAAEARSVLGDAQIALDSTVTIAPFSLALALTDAGINVSRIYTSQLPAFEKPNLEKLARLRGDIVVSNPSHARKYGPRQDRTLADIAVGFEAGYATAAPLTAPLAFDERLYGFEGFTMVLEALIRAAGQEKTDLRRQVKDYGLVV
jgi:hypothetical protein